VARGLGVLRDVIQAFDKLHSEGLVPTVQLFAVVIGAVDEAERQKVMLVRISQAALNDLYLVVNYSCRCMAALKGGIGSDLMALHFLRWNVHLKHEGMQPRYVMKVELFWRRTSMLFQKICVVCRIVVAIGACSHVVEEIRPDPQAA
jgi:uncharacterized membrane protein